MIFRPRFSATLALFSPTAVALVAIPIAPNSTTAQPVFVLNISPPGELLPRTLPSSPRRVNMTHSKSSWFSSTLGLLPGLPACPRLARRPSAVSI